MTSQRECRFGYMAAGVRKWIWLGLILVFVGAVCAGCGVERPKPGSEYLDIFIRDEAAQIEAAQNEATENETEEKWRNAPLIEIENPEEENLADWMQRNVSGAMVQIRADKVTGSGVLWKVSGEKLYIATARHVVENSSEPVEVRFVDGATAIVTESWLSGNADLAFLCVDSSVFDEKQTEQYCLVNTDKESFDELADGDGIILMASASGVGMDAYEGNLMDGWVYLEDFGQYMMHIHVYAYEGMSGGGVFDQKGHFIGIFCGESSDTDGVAVPLGILWAEFAGMLEE